MAIALTLHLFAALFWVGGMFFALVILRPAAGPLSMELRVGLWSRTLTRFMKVVWLSVITLPATGYWMIFYLFGGRDNVGLHVVIMEILGWGMIVLFLTAHFRGFLPMRRMNRELLIPEAGLYIERIRKIIQINLFLGIILISVAVGGRYW